MPYGELLPDAAAQPALPLLISGLHRLNSFSVQGPQEFPNLPAIACAFDLFQCRQNIASHPIDILVPTAKSARVYGLERFTYALGFPRKDLINRHPNDGEKMRLIRLDSVRTLEHLSSNERAPL